MSLPPKRAQSAIEASTMRFALETTMLRRRKRASQCRCREWAAAGNGPLPGLVALDAVRLLLADEQPPLRDQRGVRRPVVRAVKARVPPFHTLEQSAQGGGVTTPATPVNHSPRSTIASLPDPELAGFFLR